MKINWLNNKNNKQYCYYWYYTVHVQRRNTWSSPYLLYGNRKQLHQTQRRLHGFRLPASPSSGVFTDSVFQQVRLSTVNKSVDGKPSLMVVFPVLWMSWALKESDNSGAVSSPFSIHRDGNFSRLTTIAHVQYLFLPCTGILAWYIRELDYSGALRTGTSDAERNARNDMPDHVRGSPSSRLIPCAIWRSILPWARQSFDVSTKRRQRQRWGSYACGIMHLSIVCPTYPTWGIYGANMGSLSLWPCPIYGAGWGNCQQCTLNRILVGQSSYAFATCK